MIAAPIDMNARVIAACPTPVRIVWETGVVGGTKRLSVADLQTRRICVIIVRNMGKSSVMTALSTGSAGLCAAALRSVSQISGGYLSELAAVCARAHRASALAGVSSTGGKRGI